MVNNILVTGANGQLGNEIRVACAHSGNRYFFTDVEELDITDLNAIRQIFKEKEIDALVNCAAYTAVDKAEEDGDLADLINHQAVAFLALACKESGATLIHISTDYVFRGDKNLPCREEDPANPLGVYGQTKLSGEKAIQESGCKYLIFRTAWLYSQFGHNFVKTMLKLTSEKEQIQVVFDQVGTPTYAGDLAELICLILENKAYEGREGIYHYSNEGVCSWYDFAHEIAQIAGYSGCDVRPCHSSQFPSKVKRPVFSVLDKTKVKETFGIKIPYWKDSLVKCINHLQKTS